jgi:hypothetical protein
MYCVSACRLGFSARGIPTFLNPIEAPFSRFAGEGSLEGADEGGDGNEIF